jgi:hypothetical protein
MKETVLGVVRHILTAIGGGLIATGNVTEGDWQAIVGGVIAAIGVVWSILQKRKAQQAAAPENTATKA